MLRVALTARYAAFMLIGVFSSAYPRVKLMDVRGYSRDKSCTRTLVDFGDIAANIIHGWKHANCIHSCTQFDRKIARCFFFKLVTIVGHAIYLVRILEIL